jgi:hypothetical protein
MDHLPPPDAPDPGYLRTRAAYHHLIHTLGKSLPPPSPDTPEARFQRDQAAIAQIAALCPANAAEAALAAQFVAASEQAMDCLRLTHAPETPGNATLKCNAQAASMMRQAQSAMRTLLRVQAARQKQNADGAAWTEYAIGQMMAEPLTGPDPLPDPIPLSDPDPLSVQEAPPPATPPLAEPPLAEPSEPPAPADAVETYIHLYPKRAAEIRRARGMPRNASFAPPDDDIIKALAAGTAPALRLLGPAAA